MRRRVLFVSKPIAPPFYDGTKCLVRDVALNLTRYESTVMVPPGVTTLGYAPRAGNPGISAAQVYVGAGSYAPALADNARAAAYLAVGASAPLWHFVFAPNPRSSAIGRAARALRRTKVVQTVASTPRTFAAELFFGDAIVAQSNFTATRVVRALEDARVARMPLVRVIPPPVGPLRARTAAEIAAVARALDLPESAKVFVYPGDLEVSTGAETVARAVAPIVRALPDAVIVFACRPKTADAPRIEAELRARLDGRTTRFTREIDLPSLLALASAVLFPVDDLYGKVDLPISLLEAMRLGVPVVALDCGPLADLRATVQVPARDAQAVAESAVRLVGDLTFRRGVIGAGIAAVTERYDACVVAEAYERVYDEVLKP
ncbi:MAG TPA: glycosyltransferase family 4 protein [Polyangiaceae bacterium]|jgi:phosphatidylinositol alpha-1,6-mannosyltransferase|nr:glycosyltransferase family 4 protein [Polyangiaceae bacterium]